jgi:hypothetical protein
MRFGSFYDPHYKPDRTAAKYRADQKRDQKSTQETSAFVAKYLANWKPGKKGNLDPEATFKALRIEARRMGKLGTHPFPKKSKNKIEDSKHNKKRKTNTSKLNGKQTPQKNDKADKNQPRPWLNRESSLKYLHVANAELLNSYADCVAKIDRWRIERNESVDEKTRQKLAGQIQIQLEKRRDFLSIISHRLQEEDE